MADMKLFLQILANASGLKREMGESSTSVSRFTQGARREFDRLKGALGGIEGKLAGLGLSIGAVQQMRISAQLDKDLTQIGQTAGESAGQVALLRSDLFRMGKESGQDIESLKNGFNALVQSGLNMGEAKSTLDGVNVAMAVTGAKAETLSAGLTVAAQAFQFDLSKPGQALELLDKMTVAGRLGNAELENLSGIFARIGVNAQSAGMSFDKTLGFIEALSKVERQPERLATLADSTLRVFTNMNYMASAQKGTGIKFYSDAGKRRDPLEVLKDIKKRYDTLKTDLQRDSFVQAAFGKADLDTIKGIKTLLQSNNLPEVGRMAGLIEGAGGTLKRDVKEATRNLIDAGGRLKNTMREAADDFAKPLNETLAAWISFMLDKKENGGLQLSGGEIAGGAAAILGGTYALSKLGNKVLGKWAGTKLGSLSGSTAIGVAEGKALQAATGVTPVFVTNWQSAGVPVPGVPGQGGGAAGGAANTAAGAAGGSLLARVKDWWRIAGTPTARGASLLPMLATRAGFAGAAFGGGYLVGTGFNKGLGGLMNISSGGRYRGDGALGEMLYDLLHGGIQSNREPATNQISVEVHLDELGRAITKVNSMNTRANVKSNRGNIWDALTTTKAW